jgi:hypothetical protein
METMTTAPAPGFAVHVTVKLLLASVLYPVIAVLFAPAIFCVTPKIVSVAKIPVTVNASVAAPPTLAFEVNTKMGDDVMFPLEGKM